MHQQLYLEFLVTNNRQFFGQDPKRSDAAQRAYDDFLRGLEMINQQEYLKKEFCGKGVSAWQGSLCGDRDLTEILLPVDRKSHPR